MWFLEQVAIICLAQFIMIPFTHTKPHIYKNNNQGKGNNKQLKNVLTPVQEASGFKNPYSNSESILRAFNFHDVEYPVAATPRPQSFYFQDFNYNQSPQRNCMSDASNIKISSGLTSARNGTFNNLQKFRKPIIKSNANKPKSSLVLPKEFTSDSDFRNVGNFPEVEYPLSAKDTWKPNYWSIPSGSKDINALLSENSQPNQNIANIYPTRNTGISSKSGKCSSFSINSYSDITKNKERLKQVLENKANNTSFNQNTSTCRNDFIINSDKKIAASNIKTLPIENTEQELHTTAIPYYFTPIDILPDCEEFNMDVFNTFSIFNESKQNNNNPFFENALKPKRIETDKPFKENKALNFEEKSKILLKHNSNDLSSNNVQEMNYDLYDIIDVRKPETGSDLCGLDDDYTTDIYPEDQNIGWFSHPITTPPPFTKVDLKWKNCQIITPYEFSVDELEDCYIPV